MHSRIQNRQTRNELTATLAALRSDKDDIDVIVSDWIPMYTKLHDDPYIELCEARSWLVDHFTRYLAQPHGSLDVDGELFATGQQNILLIMWSSYMKWSKNARNTSRNRKMKTPFMLFRSQHINSQVGLLVDRDWNLLSEGEEKLWKAAASRQKVQYQTIRKGLASEIKHLPPLVQNGVKLNVDTIVKHVSAIRHAGSLFMNLLTLQSFEAADIPDAALLATRLPPLSQTTIRQVFTNFAGSHGGKWRDIDPGQYDDLLLQFKGNVLDINVWM